MMRSPAEPIRPQPWKGFVVLSPWVSTPGFRTAATRFDSPYPSGILNSGVGAT